MRFQVLGLVFILTFLIHIPDQSLSLPGDSTDPINLIIGSNYNTLLTATSEIFYTFDVRWVDYYLIDLITDTADDFNFQITNSTGYVIVTTSTIVGPDRFFGPGNITDSQFDTWTIRIFSVSGSGDFELAVSHLPFWYAEDLSPGRHYGIIEDDQHNVYYTFFANSTYTYNLYVRSLNFTNLEYELTRVDGTIISSSALGQQSFKISFVITNFDVYLRINASSRTNLQIDLTKFGQFTNRQIYHGEYWGNILTEGNSKYFIMDLSEVYAYNFVLWGNDFFGTGLVHELYIYNANLTQIAFYNNPYGVGKAIVDGLDGYVLIEIRLLLGSGDFKLEILRDGFQSYSADFIYEGINLAYFFPETSTAYWQFDTELGINYTLYIINDLWELQDLNVVIYNFELQEITSSSVDNPDILEFNGNGLPFLFEISTSAFGRYKILLSTIDNVIPYYDAQVINHGEYHSSTLPPGPVFIYQIDSTAFTNYTLEVEGEFEAFRIHIFDDQLSLVTNVSSYSRITSTSFIGTGDSFLIMISSRVDFLDTNFSLILTENRPPDNLTPLLSSPVDKTYNEGDPEMVIRWEVSDANPNVYNITLNDVLLVETTTWINGSIFLDFNSESLGEYNFTIYVFDFYGNFAVDSVFIRIIPQEVITSTTETTPTNSQVDTFDSNDTSNSASGIGNNYLIFLALGSVILTAITRKSRNEI